MIIGDDLLDLMHINKENLMADVKVRDSLIGSNHGRMDFTIITILRGANKINRTLTALNFRTVDLSLFRGMLGRIPSAMVLERKGAQESYHVFKDHPLQV